mmetsp:Transcript_19557/g.54348  ORF Transcript_19557/g.54348 Transcript_19557/m.54348 type:complete len:85 (-) Transcript_19557:423-677(-)
MQRTSTRATKHNSNSIEKGPQYNASHTMYTIIIYYMCTLVVCHSTAAAAALNIARRSGQSPPTSPKQLDPMAIQRIDYSIDHVE